MFIVQYKLKRAKDFHNEWEKARERFPQGCHLIQAISTKEGGMCFAIFDIATHKALHDFHKKFLDQHSEWKIFEIDEYHLEGEKWRKAQ